MTESQVLERPTDMPSMNDGDPFCHLYMNENPRSMCGLSYDKGTPMHGHWEPGITTCPCGNPVCPDCIAAVTP